MKVLSRKALYSPRVITKTCLYDIDPLYIVKLGFTEVYIIFLLSAQNIDCWYSLVGTHLSKAVLCFEQKYEKYQFFLSEIFQFLEVFLYISIGMFS